MRITEIRIKNFGKLHNINIRPLPGLNVIYGENETGKTTMQQFVKGMLFGAGESESFLQYQPWDNNSYYAGELKFTVGEESYLLERDFNKKEKTAKLVNESILQELSVENGDLEKLLGGMDKETYENTYCISQASIETKKEFAGILRNYCVNISRNGNGGVDLVSAQKRLKDGQESAKRLYEEKLSLRKETEEKLLLEEELLKKDVEQLKRQQKDGYKSFLKKRKGIFVPEHETNPMAEYLRDLRQQKEQFDYKVRRGFFLLITLVSLFLGVWNGMAHHLMNDLKTGWWILEAILFLWLIFGVIGAFFWHRESMHLKQIRIEQEEERREMIRQASLEKEKQEFRERQDEQVKRETVEEMLEVQLLEKNAMLMNLQEELEECRKPTDEEAEALRQVKSYELAYHTLEEISQAFYGNTREMLEQEMCRIMSELTNGKYKKIGLDEQMNLTTWDGKRMLYPWQLSRGTMEQLYVALRLGTGGAFVREESMPILMDEVFASFDEKRLEAVLQWIGKQSGQIFLFTCRKREMEILERNGIPYGKIMLSR